MSGSVFESAHRRVSGLLSTYFLLVTLCEGCYPPNPMKYYSICLSLALVACGKSDPSTSTSASQAKPLVAVCEAEAKGDKPWLCGQALSFECGKAPEEIAVPKTSGCESPYAVGPSGPYGVGTQSLQITKGSRLVCESSITVTDTLPPTIADKASELWPPNHKPKSFALADCATVTDLCDDKVTTFFRWVASNEAVNATGDGNTTSDITVGCDSITVLAERSGKGGGRMYRAGITAIDQAGNRTDGECTIVVPHDQGKKGKPTTFVEAYRVAAPSSCEPTSTQP